MKKNSKEERFVVCIRNEGYEVSVESRKLYGIVPDPATAKYSLLRVIDESGEDYLYPEDFFLSARLLGPVEKALRAVS
jgi:alpha-mannosidase